MESKHSVKVYYDDLDALNDFGKDKAINATN